MVDKMFIVVFVAGSIASLPFWRIGIRRLRQPGGHSRWDVLLPPRKRLESPLGLLDVGVAFFIWALFQAASIFIAVQMTGISEIDSNLEPAQQLTLIASAQIGQLLATSLALAIVAVRYGHAPRIFGWQNENMLTDMRLAGTAFIMTIPSLLFLSWLLSMLVAYEHQTFDVLRDQMTLVSVVVTWTTAVVLAPLTEEVFFRGFLQNWLQRLGSGMSSAAAATSMIGGFPEQWSKRNETSVDDKKYNPKLVLADSSARWMPILVTSLAFASVHLGQGLAPVTLFLFSLVLGFLYRQTGSILVCIVLHMLLNGYSMFWVTLEMAVGGSSNGL